MAQSKSASIVVPVEVFNQKVIHCFVASKGGALSWPVEFLFAFAEISKDVARLSLAETSENCLRHGVGVLPVILLVAVLI
jgi:hypothetical protein